MTRKSIRPNLNILNVYMKQDGWSGKTVGLSLDKERVIVLCRELLEAVEKSKDSQIELTIFPKRKTPTITVSWIQE